VPVIVAMLETAGQPRRELDPRHPRLRPSEQDRAGPESHLRRYLDRIESPFRPIQNSCFNNTDYRDWNAAQHAVADYITHRSGADRDRRVAALERKHRFAA